MKSHDGIMLPMPGQSRDLTDAQWALLNPLIPEPHRRKDGCGVVHGGHAATSLTVLYTSSVPVLHGPICPIVIRPTRPVIIVSSSGFVRVS